MSVSQNKARFAFVGCCSIGKLYEFSKLGKAFFSLVMEEKLSSHAVRTYSISFSVLKIR